MAVVSFAIQAHPARRELAERLATRIGGDVDVVYDPEPDAPVKSAWRSFREVFATTPPGATHRAQIQDDAIVCDGYRRAVETAVAARPERVLVFFVAGQPFSHARAVMTSCYYDEPWAELDNGFWCPVIATCWPVGLAAEMLEWVEEQGWPEKFSSDDERTGRFLTAVGHFALASVPSLAEHPDIEPSLVGRKTSGGLNPDRVAACFIGEDCGACVEEIDWNLGPGGGRVNRDNVPVVADRKIIVRQRG